MAGFAESIQINSDKILQDVNNRCFEIAKELFTSIVRLSPSPSNSAATGRESPYANGVLVNQWYPMAGGFSNSVSDAADPDGSGSIRRIEQMPKNEFLRKDGTLTLSNNLSYAYRAEVLGWPDTDDPKWKNAKPYGMVRKSLQAVVAKNKQARTKRAKK